jgi:hypothetical protein
MKNKQEVKVSFVNLTLSPELSPSISFLEKIVIAKKIGIAVNNWLYQQVWKACMRLTFKYRLYPNEGQIKCLEKTFDLCRNLYSRILRKR